ncbi:MAG TPA: SDR family NAD-dependent epimerase/dehydratase, partial [Sphingomonadaceae bacterium]|nr:SDR family NAD-dependent epimerase/dehydratase [Sphingomonadaceae bacterium]
LRLTGAHAAPVHVDLPIDDPRRRKPDISRAQELLGWSPKVPLEEGLAATVKWFAAELVEMQDQRITVAAE